jgi:hypothetical protein
MLTNSAPQTKWHRTEMACGTVRYRLFVEGRETPYFVDAATARAHYGYGDRIALWGSGMLPSRSGGNIAGFLGGFRTVELAKHAAEQRAFA